MVILIISRWNMKNMKNSQIWKNIHLLPLFLAFCLEIISKVQSSCRLVKGLPYTHYSDSFMLCAICFIISSLSQSPSHTHTIRYIIPLSPKYFGVYFWNKDFLFTKPYSSYPCQIFNHLYNDLMHIKISLSELRQ